MNVSYSTRLRYLSSILLGEAAEEGEEVVVVVAEEDTETVPPAAIPSDSGLEEGTATAPLHTGRSSSTNNNRDPLVEVAAAAEEEEEEEEEEEAVVVVVVKEGRALLRHLSGGYKACGVLVAPLLPDPFVH